MRYNFQLARFVMVVQTVLMERMRTTVLKVRVIVMSTGMGSTDTGYI